MVIGVSLLFIRKVGGNEIVDGLVKVPSNKPAVHEVWTIATSLLFALAVALIVYGLVIVGSAWMAGDTRPALSLRRSLAPTLRKCPAVAYGAAGGVLLLVVAWGPAPAFRNVATIVLFAGLLALGVAMLRRQTAMEFPRVEPSSSATPSLADPGGRLDAIERLVALHDRGELTDDEFAAGKAHLVTTVTP